MSASEFSASRWTAACRECKRGGTARARVSSEKGDAKIKQKRKLGGKKV